VKFEGDQWRSEFDLRCRLVSRLVDLSVGLIVIGLVLSLPSNNLVPLEFLSQSL
jgi:hypothetical protein